MNNDKMNIADSSSLHLQQAPCCVPDGEIRDVAIKFAEFIANNKFKYRFLNYWEENNFSHTPYTTSDLFELFKKEYNVRK